MTDDPENPKAIPTRLNATIIIGAFITGAAAGWGVAGALIIGRWFM